MGLAYNILKCLDCHSPMAKPPSPLSEAKVIVKYCSELQIIIDHGPAQHITQKHCMMHYNTE